MAKPLHHIFETAECKLGTREIQTQRAVGVNGIRVDGVGSQSSEPWIPVGSRVRTAVMEGEGTPKNSLAQGKDDTGRPSALFPHQTMPPSQTPCF